MVKNYLVCAIRPTTEIWYRERHANLHEQYHKMYQMRSASFRKFVQEPFEEILWTEPVANNDEYTVANWYAIKQLWESEPCNIFWAGADTLMIRPTNLFNPQFKEYRLFNYTDPKEYKEFEHYFNDDIQYYPHTMSKETWNLGEKLWNERETHPDRNWGFDQIRHNHMFWSQSLEPNDRLYAQLAYQAFMVRSLRNPDAISRANEWNGLELRDAHILHFHASRGTHQVIQVMQEICEQLQITL